MNFPKRNSQSTDQVLILSSSHSTDEGGTDFVDAAKIHKPHTKYMLPTKLSLGTVFKPCRYPLLALKWRRRSFPKVQWVNCQWLIRILQSLPLNLVCSTKTLLVFISLVGFASVACCGRKLSLLPRPKKGVGGGNKTSSNSVLFGGRKILK